MSGLLGAYEDSDEDDDAPSILAQAAAQQVAAAAVRQGAGSPAEGAGIGGGANAAAADAAPLALAADIRTAAAAETTDLIGRKCPAGGRLMATSPLVWGASSSDSADSAAEEGDPDPVALIPPSPPGEPDADLLERVRALHEMRCKGKNVREHIRGSRDWSNPYILERVIKHFDLEEYGSNFPSEVFDPRKVAEHPSDYFDAPECERPPAPKRQRSRVHRQDSAPEARET